MFRKKLLREAKFYFGKGVFGHSLTHAKDDFLGGICLQDSNARRPFLKTSLGYTSPMRKAI